MVGGHALVRPLERLELLRAEPYEELAAVHSEAGEARALFTGFGMEERSHATQVAYLRRLASQNPWALAGVDLDVADVLATTDEAFTLCSHLPAVSLAEAVRLLLESEERVGEAQGRHAVAAACQELTVRLNLLARGDQEHAARSRRFAHRRCIAAGAAEEEDNRVRP